MNGSALGEAAERTGVVHLGAGAFARAHPWLCTARAVDGAVDGADADGSAWGVCAVGQRSATVVDALRAHDWRYRVVERDGDRSEERCVGVVRDGLVAADEPDRLCHVLADPAVRVVTTSVTEAAYAFDPTTRRLLPDHAGIAADIAGAPGHTVVGQVLAAAAGRAKAGVGPLSVVVCDNIIAGGSLLRALVLELARLRSDYAAAAWVADNMAFPESVVDRVVPAVATADQPSVTAEAFFRWVLQDAFAAGRPEWEHGGAVLVDDVTAWQDAKLRLVNAPHSLLAYAGLGSGHRTTAEACADPLLRDLLEQALADDLVPTLTPSPGLDPEAEAASSLRRFANTGIEHRLEQIAADGSHKLPQRLAGAVQSRQDAGHLPRWLTLTVACWAHAVASGAAADSRASDVRDAWAGAGGAERARRLLDLPGGWPDALRSDDVVDAVGQWCDRLERHGVRETLVRATGDGEATAWT